VEKLQFLLRKYKLDVHSLVFKGGFSALQLCALHGHDACVSFLITELHVNVNQINPLDNSTALHVAACGGSLACVQALVELGGANINCVTEMGFTPLHYSVLAGKTDVYVYLISTGLVDVSFKNADGITPLLAAARAGQLRACQHLIENAAVSLDECDNNGCSALHYACAGGNKDLVKYLLAKGANASSKDKKGRLPIDLATESAIASLLSAHGGGPAAGGGSVSSASIFSFFGSTAESGTSSNASDRDTATEGSGRRERPRNRQGTTSSLYGMLSAMCRSGRVDELEKILSQRANFNVGGLIFNGGWNCLHLCAQSGHTACVELSCAKTNIDANAENSANGITALHLAARYSHLATMKALVKAGSSVNCRTFKGKVPLHFVAAHGDDTSLSFLLALDADTYAQDAKGQTALMMAVRRGDLRLTDLILQQASDANICDVKGRNALYFARRRPDLVSVLVRHGAVECPRALANARRRTTDANERKDDDDAPLRLRAPRSTSSVAKAQSLASADDDDDASEVGSEWQDAWVDSNAAGLDSNSSVDDEECPVKEKSKVGKKGTDDDFAF